jgi:hypothetical protein
MSATETNHTLKRLRNRYRLVVMNDDTYEEVVTFKLSRRTVYVAVSSIFIVLVSLTIVLVAFTPLKYYIPGYGTRQSRADLQVLKIRTDSLEQALRNKERYLDNVKKILSGGTPTQLDTVPVDAEPKDISRD